MNLRRWGKSPQELGVSTGGGSCPDVLEMEDGNSFLVIGHRLGPGRVVLPGRTLRSAAADARAIADA